MKYVLDACALIALIKKEQGFELVRDIIEKTSNEVLLHSVNLLEVYYELRRDLGEEADKLLTAVKYSPIDVIFLITDELIRVAARFKNSYKISLGDSFVLATAHISGGTVVSSDHHEFDIIENSKEKIAFCWMR
ncbi:hypothetical protein FACS1894216_19040 [Synergistales bacterium]|nr:hypothetical protein FACS1894216_19040 [Synergistales bacterium]